MDAAEDPLMSRGFSPEDVSVLSVYDEPWPITPPETPSCRPSDCKAANTPSRPILDHNLTRRLQFDPPKGKRGHPSLLSKKQRRKRYRHKKKMIHRFGKEKWETMAKERLQLRWRERSHNVHKAYLVELERKKAKEKEEKARDLQCKEALRDQQVNWNERIDSIEDKYAEASQHNNGSLLLDAVLIPVEEPTSTCHSESLVHSTQCMEHVKTARDESDRALRLAKHYRNMAEETHREKRDLQHRLETQVELVRNFWRNQLVEGNSRSGRMLCATLTKK